MEDFNKYTSHINYSPIVDFVLQQGKQSYYKKGDYFSRQGEVCKTMGFVSSGSFRYCCTNSVGENSIVGYTFDHSFVGNYCYSFYYFDKISLSEIKIKSYFFPEIA